MTSRSRRSYLAGLGTVSVAAFAGCSGQITGSGSSDGTDGSPRDSTAPTPDGDTTPPPGVPTEGAPPLADAALPTPSAPGSLAEKTMNGGPGKDGIPSIDDPSFVAAADADFLADGDPVFGVRIGEAVKAYPQKVLVWHEITNDVVAGTPVSVTYCPLTGTAMGFYRGKTTFGVSGNLLNNNLVMYDRETDSRWPQVLATAVSGTHVGRSLREFRVTWTTWEAWRSANPETRVLSTDTGFARDYSRDPYGSYNPVGGYYQRKNTLFPKLNEDDRLHPKTVVVGARTRANADPAGAIAFEKEALGEAGVLTGSIGDLPVVGVHDPALDAGHVYRNPGGATVEQASSGVTVDGEPHPPDDLPLDRLLATDAMWFAWAGFYPETGLVN